MRERQLLQLFYHRSLVCKENVSLDQYAGIRSYNFIEELAKGYI